MRNERLRRIRGITLWGMAVNVFLVILKFLGGVLVRSSALIADGVHSFSDLVTDVIVLVGVRLGSRPPDDTHPYGHSKLETISSQVVALALLLVSVGLIWSAVVSIYGREHHYPGPIVLVVASISVLSKEVVFFLTRKVALQTGSSALYANAWHHRSDSLSSVAVLIGGAAGLLGWGHADQAATIVVGIMILFVSGKILYRGLLELSEHAADREFVEIIESVLAEEEGVRQWHDLRTRNLGSELFIDVHVLVDPAMSVLKSHKISMDIEAKIRERLPRPANILVHIEPDITAMQK